MAKITKRIFAVAMVLAMLVGFAQPVSAAKANLEDVLLEHESFDIGNAERLSETMSQQELMAKFQEDSGPMAAQRKKLPAKEPSAEAYAEADQVFAAIDQLETSPAKKGTAQNQLVDAVVSLIENSDSYVAGSLERKGNAVTWWTTGGIHCVYSPRMQEIGEGLTPETGENVIVNEPRVTKGGSPAGNQVYLIGPYYGYDDSFTSQYRKEAQSIAKAIGDVDGFTLYSGTAATVDKVAEAVSNGAVVIFDSHGMTDYENPYNELDCVTEATNSYLCLTSTIGLTSADYADGALYYDDGIYINGETIANHMTQKSPSGILWMAMCFGMATDTICKPMRRMGAEVVYGYSESVAFGTDYRYEECFWDEMLKGNTVAESIATMKETWGEWDWSIPIAESYGERDGLATISDAREIYYAFPVVVSDEDTYPGKRTAYTYGVDSLQKVYSTYTLGELTEAPLSAKPYQQQVTEYINAIGEIYDDGIPTLIDMIEGESTDYYFMMENVDGNIRLTFISYGYDSSCADIYLEVLLPKNSTRFNVDFLLEYYYNYELIDTVETAFNDYRSGFSTQREYSCNGGAVMNSENAAAFLNLALQWLVEFWDIELYEALGFGFKCLGFTAYEGYGDLPCIHVFSNDCDATCNNCGAVRSAGHNYVDGVCSVCGEKDPDQQITGDFTGDRLVTNDDVVYLLWHTMFPEEYPLEAGVDYTGDGLVTNEDVVYLLWHTMFPETYPL